MIISYFNIHKYYHLLTEDDLTSLHKYSARNVVFDVIRLTVLELLFEILFRILRRTRKYVSYVVILSYKTLEVFHE